MPFWLKFYWILPILSMLSGLESAWDDIGQLHNAEIN